MSVDAAVDEKVAHDAEKDDGVHARVKETAVVEIGESTEGGGEQDRGCDEDEPAMQLGLFAPVDARG